MPCEMRVGSLTWQGLGVMWHVHGAMSAHAATCFLQMSDYNVGIIKGYGTTRVRMVINTSARTTTNGGTTCRSAGYDSNEEVALQQAKQSAPEEVRIMGARSRAIH